MNSGDPVRMQTKHMNELDWHGSMQIRQYCPVVCEATIRKTVVSRIVSMTNFHGPLGIEEKGIQYIRLCINKRIKMAENV